jgi:predicted nucleic acid-binding protein
VIFVDANVPMYLVGGDASAIARARVLLERLAATGAPLVTSAEVLQEILHRFRSIDRLAEVQAAFDAVAQIIDDVLPVTADDARRAKEILLSRPDLQARDCMHLATMERHGITRIASFDRDFDAVPGIERLA